MADITGAEREAREERESMLAALAASRGDEALREDKVLLGKVEASLERTRDLLELRTRERDDALAAAPVASREVEGNT